MEIETFRLLFLQRMRACKRPPPTLRATGFRALDEAVRIQLLSDMETTALAKAIQKKKKDVKLLKRTAENCKEVLKPK